MSLIDAHDLWTEIMMLPHNGDMISSEEVEKAIVEAPAVDAVPVVHGRWEEVYTCNDEWLWGYRCNQCNVEHSRKDNFCPNCGAKMDGGEEDGSEI